jgi:hypothetical protein
MPAPLPPELSRLGDELSRATERAARARRRRLETAGRLAATVAAAALAFGILNPGALGRGDGTVAPLQLASSTGYAPVACDQPRGATFNAARPCGRPGATDASPVLARRYGY